MSALATPELLVGRTIVGFALRSWPDGRGGMAHAPVLRLDNGAYLVLIPTLDGVVVRYTEGR